MLAEGGPGWSDRENLWTLERTGLPLGVECRQCRHRALVPFPDPSALRSRHDPDQAAAVGLSLRLARLAGDHLPAE
jgi:hypothetical protein